MSYKIKDTVAIHPHLTRERTIMTTDIVSENSAVFPTTVTNSMITSLDRALREMAAE